MTITQYLPQWLRGKLQRPASQNVRAPGKKDRQTLPTAPKPASRPIRLQEDESADRFRIYWRM